MNYSKKIVENIIGKKKQIKDSDNDGIEDKKDCQPHNTMRQDAITSGGMKKLQNRLQGY